MGADELVRRFCVKNHLTFVRWEPVEGSQGFVATDFGPYKQGQWVSSLTFDLQEATITVYLADGDQEGASFDVKIVPV